MQDNAFGLWFQSGIRTVRNLFVDGVFASFQQLAEKFHFPNSHLFRYLQVRDICRKMYRDFPHTHTADTPIGKILKAPMVMKGLISSLFNSVVPRSGCRSDRLMGVYPPTRTLIFCVCQSQGYSMQVSTSCILDKVPTVRYLFQHRLTILHLSETEI